MLRLKVKPRSRSTSKRVLEDGLWVCWPSRSNTVHFPQFVNAFLPVPPGRAAQSSLLRR
jgi:hypothetical protein